MKAEEMYHKCIKSLEANGFEIVTNRSDDDYGLMVENYIIICEDYDYDIRLMTLFTLVHNYFAFDNKERFAMKLVKKRIYPTEYELPKAINKSAYLTLCAMLVG